MKRRIFSQFTMNFQLKICLLVAALLCLGTGYYLGKKKEHQCLSQTLKFIDLGKDSTVHSEDNSLENISYMDGANTHNKMASYAKGGNVPDVKTASQVAYAILCAVYGEDVMMDELPLQVYLENEKLWCIEGTSHEGYRRVATISIDKKDARVLSLYQSK